MRQWSLPIVAWVAAGLALVAIGLVVGMKLPRGVKNAQVVDGIAVLHNEETGFASFEGDGGETTAFSAHEIQWHARGESEAELLRVWSPTRALARRRGLCG